VIKLRLECNNAPLLIAGAFQAPRILFILRDPVQWAASLRRVSRNSLDLNWAIDQLRRGLQALDALRRSYRVHVSYYEDFCSLAPDRVAELLAWAGASRRLSEAELRGLASRDAQEGTVVSRASLRDIPDDAAFRQAFEREWSRRRPRELIDRLGLRLV
jgi:hypothetical protein